MTNSISQHSHILLRHAPEILAGGSFINPPYLYFGGNTWIDLCDAVGLTVNKSTTYRVELTVRNDSPTSEQNAWNIQPALDDKQSLVLRGDVADNPFSTGIRNDTAFIDYASSEELPYEQGDVRKITTQHDPVGDITMIVDGQAITNQGVAFATPNLTGARVGANVQGLAGWIGAIKDVKVYGPNTGPGGVFDGATHSIDVPGAKPFVGNWSFDYDVKLTNDVTNENCRAIDNRGIGGGGTVNGVQSKHQINARFFRSDCYVDDGSGNFISFVSDDDQSGPSAVGKWTKARVEWDGTIGRVISYKDGVEQKRATSSALIGATFPGTIDLSFGGYVGSSQKLAGNLRDIRFYDSDGVVIHDYPIDEGSGTVINDVNERGFGIAPSGNHVRIDLGTAEVVQPGDVIRWRMRLTDNETTYTVISQAADTSYGIRIVIVNTPYLQWVVDGVTRRANNVTVTAGQWFDVEFTCGATADDCSLLINGVQGAVVASGSSPLDTTGNASLMSKVDGGNGLRGTLQNVEIQRSGSVIHRWNIDDQDETEITDSVGGVHGTLNDTSGTFWRANGTLNGDPNTFWQEIDLPGDEWRLEHHWPLNRPVEDGMIVPDVVGGCDGKLELGDGHWVERPNIVTYGQYLFEEPPQLVEYDSAT